MTDATTEQPAMQIDICELIAKFSETLTDFQRNFESAYEEVKNAQATIEKFGKAAEAAEAEGKAFSSQIRDIYRNGGSEKDAVKFKVQQRQAFENAEIMRSLRHDGSKTLARAELNAHQAASSIKATHDSFLSALEKHLEERLAEVVPQDIWFYLDVVSCRAKRGLNITYNSRTDIHTSEDFAVREFGRIMNFANAARGKPFSVMDLLPPLPSGISGYGKSPIQMQKLRDEIDKIESLEEEV